jgi:hypothetical protein
MGMMPRSPESHDEYDDDDITIGHAHPRDEDLDDVEDGEDPEDGIARQTSRSAKPVRKIEDEELGDDDVIEEIDLDDLRDMDGDGPDA